MASRLMYKMNPAQLARIRQALAASKSALSMLRDDSVKNNESIMTAHWSEWLAECEAAIHDVYYAVIPVLETISTIEEELEKNPQGWEAV